MQTCPICQSKATKSGDHCADDVNCERCGRFRILFPIITPPNITPRQIANASGWIREHQNTGVVGNELYKLFDLKSPPVGDKADKLLLRLQEIDSSPGAIFHFQYLFETEIDDEAPFPDSEECERINELLGVTWSAGQRELRYLMVDYLHNETHYLDRHSTTVFKISPKGWAHIHSVQHGRGVGELAFIAMSFAPSLDAVSTVLAEAIDAAGFKPLRIDKHPHNNKIDDEIVAAIRRSKFVVCDFTGQRGGVYFEAGFALGLGLPVIWVCQKDEIDDVHFDNRQYNFILWESDKLHERKRALQARIEATIGIGPLKPT
jgi:hypothetical protein